ncbi:MAG: rhamnogalacturonan acetylesterase [Bacteroidales bacterium]|nr:rhamnogalacturonan acetylesterase [Bacteroidales bacterium]
MKRIKYFIELALATFLLSAFCWVSNKPVIYMAGDSTMADKVLEDNPERGWGQLLHEFFNNEIAIENHAMNGRSTRSFIYEGRWDSLVNKLKKGDFVVIQFGHNDESIQKLERYCTPTEYRYNLRRFIKDVRGKGAKPILCTSIQRRKFDENGVFQDTHGDYPGYVRELAVQLKVPLVDMQQKSEKVIVEHGLEGSKKIFLHIEPGVYKSMPDGKTDNTHFSEYGARLMAGLFCEGLKEINSDLVKYFSPEYIKQ